MELMRRTITEGEAERIADDMLLSRIRTDHAYLHAASGEDQAMREREISEEVWDIVDRLYDY